MTMTMPRTRSGSKKSMYCIYCTESGRPSAEMSDFSIIASRPFCVWNRPSSILSESGPDRIGLSKIRVKAQADKRGRFCVSVNRCGRAAQASSLDMHFTARTMGTERPSCIRGANLSREESESLLERKTFAGVQPGSQP